MWPKRHHPISDQIINYRLPRQKLPYQWPHKHSSWVFFEKLFENFPCLFCPDILPNNFIPLNKRVPQVIAIIVLISTNPIPFSQKTLFKNIKMSILYLFVHSEYLKNCVHLVIIFYCWHKFYYPDDLLASFLTFKKTQVPVDYGAPFEFEFVPFVNLFNDLRPHEFFWGVTKVYSAASVARRRPLREKWWHWS